MCFRITPELAESTTFSHPPTPFSHDNDQAYTTPYPQRNPPPSITSYPTRNQPFPHQSRAMRHCRDTVSTHTTAPSRHQCRCLLDASEYTLWVGSGYRGGPEGRCPTLRLWFGVASTPRPKLPPRQYLPPGPARAAAVALLSRQMLPCPAPLALVARHMLPPKASMRQSLPSAARLGARRSAPVRPILPLDHEALGTNCRGMRATPDKPAGG
jgi:hypothetical protein